MSKSWKVAESRVGAWLGAKGIGRSGRVPLSGGNSSITRSDHPHPTIFNECKRDRRYNAVVRRWKDLAEEHGPGVVLRLNSGLVCFPSAITELVLQDKVLYFPWEGRVCAAVGLYNKSREIWLSSKIDRCRKVCSVTLCYPQTSEFWIIILQEDLKIWWDYILAARIEREAALKDEGIS